MHHKQLNSPWRYWAKLFFAFAIVFNLALGNQYAQKLVYRNKLGAKVLTSEEYAKLPKANWDTLAKYSSTAHKFAFKSTSTSGSTVMLNTPPVGNQGDQGSCVGWAIGYTAAGILTYPKYGCWNPSLSMRSPSYVYNQIKLSSDCTSGSYMSSALNLVSTQGVCSYSLMPYVYEDCSTLPNAT